MSGAGSNGSSPAGSVASSNRIPIHARSGVVAHAQVDAEDFDYLSQFRWNRNRKGYAIRYVYKDSRTICFFMHREILGLAHGDERQGDHINHDPLDNRRENLRIAEPGQNQQNRRSGYGRHSQHRGVTRNKDGRWIAQAQLHGRCHHLGCFEHEEDAAKAAADFRAEHMPFSQEAHAA